MLAGHLHVNHDKAGFSPICLIANKEIERTMMFVYYISTQPVLVSSRSITSKVLVQKLSILMYFMSSHQRKVHTFGTGFHPLRSISFWELSILQFHID
ncbi:hypothetical protein NECAME_01767 [Necator americanus]|uniref:Uncharacterized protein n=1 Tax=Necator americanus TaxID=51031 RepID=W2TMY0_NECAM|nr:hypothetical protein NECAME_01767 [Necator americanus]ETN83460.1 hypothetical protein NECAME_01767 [Necator americanus]